MATPAEPSVLFVGNDPPLEYLLTRYAQRSGCQILPVRQLTVDPAFPDIPPLSIWFGSFEVLEAAPQIRGWAANQDIPIVVCSSVADEARASELGADYVFLHPITYDCFASTLGSAGHLPAS